MDLDVAIERKSFVQQYREITVLQHFECRIQTGKIVCLYGRSGCGKTTALRILAGLDTNFEGHLRLGRQDVTGPTQEIGLVVQTPLAFEWLTVADNLGFGLKYSTAARDAHWLRRCWGGVAPRHVRREAERLADLVGLSRQDLTKRPAELSGGMKRRMAFGRALLLQPKVLLLDEPFSSLDSEARQALQDLVLKIRQELGTTIVCVSHDPDEVVHLADEVLVLGGSPATILHRFVPNYPERGSPHGRYSEDSRMLPFVCAIF